MKLKYFPLQRFMRQTFNSLSKISRVHSPLLLMHGERDHLMPVAMPHALYAQATTPHKTLLMIPNAGHNDVITIGEQQLFSHLDRLLAETAETQAR